MKFLEKPIFGGSANNIEGKVKLNGTKLFVVSGKWDRTVSILDCKTNEEKVCYVPIMHVYLMYISHSLPSRRSSSRADCSALSFRARNKFRSSRHARSVDICQ